MSPPEEPPRADVSAAFRKLEQLLRARPKAFAKVGGDVAFFVKGAEIPNWHLTLVGGEVVARPGIPPFPIVTIGLIADALQWMVEGTLDVERAFKKKRLAVEGDFAALGRFVECF